MSLRQAAQQAVEAWFQPHGINYVDFKPYMEALRAALAEPEQEPVTLPCCGYTNASAIKWNPHNQVVQCHNCGQVYTAPTPRKPEQECDKDPRGCWSVRCQLGKKCKNAPTPQPEQAFDLCDVCGLRTLMPEAAPTPRKPLTQDQIDRIIFDTQITLKNYCDDEVQTDFARRVEAAHGIKEQEHE